jgi:hypothetical protein
MNPAGRVRCNMRKQIELGRDELVPALPAQIKWLAGALTMILLPRESVSP